MTASSQPWNLGHLGVSDARSQVTKFQEIKTQQRGVDPVPMDQGLSCANEPGAREGTGSDLGLWVPS